MFSHGYTTGTFDTLHVGHLNLLAEIKRQCRRVTVGLTTDELGAVQKRRPVFAFEHRRALLLATKYVDDVVEHTGRSKQEDLLVHRFTFLGIGSDYEHSAEYTTFAQDNPQVPVCFIQRTPGVSSSMLLRGLEPSVMAYGIQGPVFQLGDRVIKYIPVRSREWNTTADVYQMPLPRPRNWKVEGAVVRQFNNIPGVNSMREIRIFTLLRQFPWFLGRQGEYAWTSDDPPVGMPPDSSMSQGNWELNRCHDPICAVFKLTQAHGGPTLFDWWTTAAPAEKKAVWLQLEGILTTLAEIHVVHGDLHARNICVDHSGHVSIIDFGWCTADSFDMDDQERQLHVLHLQEGFDRTHLNESLRFDHLELVGE